MQRNIGSTDALLSRVSQQINKSRKSTQNNEDLQNYLSSLKKQTKGSTVTFKDISDISLSSEDTDIDISYSSSKQNVRQTFFKNDLDFQKSSYIKPAPNLSVMKRSQTDEMLTAKSFNSEFGNIMPALLKGRGSSTQTSSALDRASKLFAKFGKKPSVSKSSVGKSRINGKDSGSGKFQNNRKSHNHDHDNSTSDDNIGKTGRRFLKPQLSKESLSGAVSTVTDKESENKSQLKTESVKEISHSYSGVTSGDESLAEFIGKLESPSEATHKDVPKENKQNKDYLTTQKSFPQKPHTSLLYVRSPSPSHKISTLRSTPSPGVKTSIEDMTIAESLTAETIPEEEDEADVEEEDEEDVAGVAEVLSQSNETEHKVDSSEDLSRMNIFNIDDLELASTSAVSPGNEEREEQTSQAHREEQTSKAHREEQTSKAHREEQTSQAHREEQTSKARREEQTSKAHREEQTSKAHREEQTSKAHQKKQLISRKESQKSISEDIPVKEKATNIFSSFGVQSIEELLPRNHSALSNYHTVSFEGASIVKTASQLEVSIEETVSGIPLSRKHTPSLAMIEAYSEDFTSFSSSKPEIEEYTEDFHTLSASKTIDSVTNTSTIYVTKSRVSKKKKQKHKTSEKVSNVGTQTQDSDFKPCWKCLYNNQDWKGRPLHNDNRTKVSPPKPGYYSCGFHSIMNPNVYSPNLQVVQDMMRQQVEFTQQFCESQKYLYHTLVNSIQPTYVYTTLKDTKEYIRKHRKPKLTLKKALKLVELEARLQ